MEIVSGRQACIEALAKKGEAVEGAEVTYGLVFLKDGKLTPDDLIALKEAVRLCDVTLVASLERVLPENYANLVQKAGACVLYTHKKAPVPGLGCQLFQEGGGNITAYLEVVLLVMPSVVVAHHETLETLKALKSLEGTFYQLFTLIEVSTPAHILSQRQQDLVQVLLLAQDMLDQGERRIQPLMQQVLAAMQRQDFGQVKQLALLDAATFKEVKTTLPQHSFLFAEVVDGEKTFCRSVRLRT